SPFACPVSSTFFTHAHIISNYSLRSCPHIKSSLAPVSYSIATWEPQRQLWMLMLFLHLPARTLLMIV
ncbi:hypothetical protein PENTCL1PPCAC_21560, partial [Pristionchus entomophagus]